MHRELHDAAELLTFLSHMTPGTPLGNVRLQGVNLAGAAGRALLAVPASLHGLVVLGGKVPNDIARRLVERGAILFPADPSAPVDPYRARLYDARELYRGLDEHGYDATVDAVTYRWSRKGRSLHDAYTTALRALHDDSIRDALHEALDALPTVGIMGGHAIQRDSPTYRHIAQLAKGLADAGLVVLTGGGPGAMEAANLGATDRTGRLDDAVDVLAQHADFHTDITAWARAGFEARSLLLPPGGHPTPSALHGITEPGLRSVGIPTWFYGHEPPNVFADVIAKYFSNALREDDLLAGSRRAVVVLDGAAGTVQEIFQSVTPLYYAPEDVELPHLVLVGREQWTHRVPVWDSLQVLARGRRFASHLHLVDTMDEASDLVLTASPLLRSREPHTDGSTVPPPP